MESFETKMNKALQKLALDIIPSDDRLKEADKIIKLLQTRSKFDIGRVCISGSSGKKTTVISSDIDVVLFINDERPRFTEVLEDFENILTMTDSFKIRDVNKRKYSIHFKALDFEFDVLPAANFTQSIRANGDDLIDIQRERVLAQIRKDPKKYCYMYSSSLAEAATRFMRRQPGFANEMVRIAKFWYKTLHFEDSHSRSAAKHCIELIAVYAANQEEKMQTISYLRCFHRFIDNLQRFNNLDIRFEEYDDQVLDRNRPRVMDPVNPYNNLANVWNQERIKTLQVYANESNRRLQALANSGLANLDQLFEPQPLYRLDLSQIYKFDPTKSQWIISTTTFSSLPDLKVRNEEFHKDRKLCHFLEILKVHFQTAIFAASASNSDDNYVKNAVQNTIARSVCNSNVTWVSAYHDKHEDYDVTFTIPFSNQNAIRVSYRL